MQLCSDSSWDWSHTPKGLARVPVRAWKSQAAGVNLCPLCVDSQESPGSCGSHKTLAEIPLGAFTALLVVTEATAKAWEVEGEGESPEPASWTSCEFKMN